MPSRRRFLGTLAATGAAGCKWASQLFLLRPVKKTADVAQPEWASSRIRAWRPLGKTGFRMSDVSFGCGNLSNPDVVRAAIERGVIYFDTSPDYSNAASERALGEALRGQDREKLFIVSKFCTPDGHLPADTPTKGVIAAVEASLSRLGVDYLDLCHVHACNDLDRLLAPTFHEAFHLLRDQQKLRFMGVSSHTPNVEQVMRTAVDSGKFDVIMVAYNFGDWPALHGIFRDAHARGTGVVAMKTLKGAKHNALSDFTPTERESFAQAAFKWVLSNPNVSGLVVSIDDRRQLDEYLVASGAPIGTDDVALLEKYDRAIKGTYCPPGCGACLASCPAGVPVDDVLRYAMYYEDYRHERVAIESYAKVPAGQRGSACAGCPAPCEAACPEAIGIREKLLRTDRLLTVA
jgi:predicted aldo/keto reductase-like oxidoreductase